jgi:gluconokinase
MVVIVMGVAGSGKTTVGRLLAQRMGWPFLDADDFHPPENVEKMRQGIGLTDAERLPWLDALAARIRSLVDAGDSAVVACSALKEAYRERLALDPAVRFVHLHGDFDLIRKRLAERKGHYAHADLLASQFEALEPPRGVPTFDVAPPPEAIVEEIRKALGLADPRP